jgi:ElaB/YqjD/DUF883 family membrane-anchored ribosome-binding protein
MDEEKKTAPAKPAAKKAPAAKKPAAAKSAKTETTAKKPAATKKAVAKPIPDPGKTVKNASVQAKDELSKIKQQASEKARDAANRGKDRAAEAMDGISKLIRESADTIDEKVGKQYGDYARSAADSVDGFANKVDSQDVDALVEEARHFVRKSPAVAIGAAAAIGFVLARIVRSGQ